VTKLIDGGERGTKFVGDVGEELILELHLMGLDGGGFILHAVPLNGISKRRGGRARFSIWPLIK